jgi:hypothetical protein
MGTWLEVGISPIPYKGIDGFTCHFETTEHPWMKMGPSIPFGPLINTKQSPDDRRYFQNNEKSHRGTLVGNHDCL